MSDTLTNRENVTESAGHGDAITASPRPWRIKHPGEIEDANGKLLYNLRDCIGGGVDEANAALIVEAVNCHAAWLATADELKRLREERDRAIAYAKAAPHPGSASWKKMQAAVAELHRLRDIVRRMVDALAPVVDDPGRQTCLPHLRAGAFSRAQADRRRRSEENFDMSATDSQPETIAARSEGQ